jgi:hypothetical protein
MPLAIFLIASSPATAQWIGKQTGCYADSIEAHPNRPIIANPNRPTVANPADITQYGVLELEYGWDRTWPGTGIHQTALGGLLKFALFCDVELRWNTTSFLSQTDISGEHRTIGDNWLGTQVRLYRQTKRVPTLAFSYSAKIPSASTDDGLGTGAVDHSFTFLASKDIGGFHFDFNATHFWIGREGTSGFDQNDEFNLAFSHSIFKGLGVTGELYGDTSLNPSTPRYVSSLGALTYTITPRLVVDSGFENGLTSGGPRRHIFAGLTYSIANLYPRRPAKTGDQALK